MADQVNPTGGLAPGLSLALLLAANPKPAQDKTRAASVADAPVSANETSAVPSAENAGDDSTSSSNIPSNAVEQLNNYLQRSGTDLKFQVDQATGRTVFKVVSQNSGEILLQVPSEEMLSMARKLRELTKQMDASGVLLDREG